MTSQADPADGGHFAMTDLEERLQAGDGLQVHAAVLSRLAQLDIALGAMVGRGLTREAFQRAQAIRGAVQAARDFIAARR